MAGIAYLNQHQITPVLNAAVNDLAREAPAEPFDFLINALLKAAKARGVETALEQRLKSIQSTLTQEQAEAQREIAVLKKRVAELEGGGGAGGGGAPVAGNVKIPVGHTPFSWTGGLASSAAPAAAPSKAPAPSPAPAAPAAKAPAPAPAKKENAKAKPAAQKPAEAPKDEAALAAEAAAKAAKDREKFLAKIVQEGGKKVMLGLGLRVGVGVS